MAIAESQDALRWDDLRVFLAMARSGSLAAAAEALGVNASTVHRRLGALEDALGAPLLARSGRGSALTALGEALVGHAEEVEEAVSGLRRTVVGHDRTASGPVTLTLPDTLVPWVVPALARVRAQCPGLLPILKVDDQMLDLGVDADVALRPSASPPESAVGRRIGRVAWARYAHGAADEVPWVFYTPNAGPVGARRWLDAHHPDVPVLLEASTVGAVHRVLACTPSQSVLPCFLADAEPALTREGPVIEALSTDLWLLVHADLRRAARVRALLDLLGPELDAARPALEGNPGASR